MPITYSDISKLNNDQIVQYRKAIINAFPEIVRRSPVIAKYWDRIEFYFPQYQMFMINDEGIVVGFINSIPFYWNDGLDKLPREGWDWMLMKGVEDYEKGIKPNGLGGLQIIVSNDYLGQGYSKIIINKAKQLVAEFKFDNFVIPIRPTYKSLHPHMSMIDYIGYREKDQIYDPWIRSHIKGGAEILNVCDRAMHVYGNLTFWEGIMKQSLVTSGQYIVEGALCPVSIDVQKDYGEYFEDNIWISYPTS